MHSRVAMVTTILAMALTLAGCQRCTAQPQRPAKAGGRLVILGFDGLDPRRVDTLIARGRLPHMAALGAQGHRGPLGTTNPPQSPVAWATFATGALPGTHGIFDFVQRNAETYMPQVATTRVHHAVLEQNRLTVPWVDNLRQGEAFWDVIARTGVSVRTLSVPYAYPPRPDGAHALAGLGAPDLRGTNSSFTWLTTDAQRVRDGAPAGGQVALLERGAEGHWHARLGGPRLRIDGAMVNTDVGVTVAPTSTPDALHITVGTWEADVALHTTSAYAPIKLLPSPNLALNGTARFTVRQVNPPDIYVEPLSMVPHTPYLPLSQPSTYAEQLWATLGPNKSVGWSDDTSALGAGAMDEGQFLAEARHNMAWLTRALLAALGDKTDKIVVAVFTSPDRVAHMFARAEDPNHPAYTAALAPFADAISQSYEAADAVVGKVVAQLDPADALLVMSDHGFATFARGFHLNRWLVDTGFLRLRQHAGASRPFFADVDWAATQAYAYGTGSIFLNRRGREAQGVVTDAEAPDIVTRIVAKLAEVHDGEKHGIVRGYPGDTLFAGPQRSDAPDIRVGMADGYRASWATALGGMGDSWFEDNQKKWSGDHASSHPEDVPGILLANRKIILAQPRIEDLARTAYEFVGVAAPPACTGRPLW